MALQAEWESAICGLLKLPNVLGQVFENFVVMELVKQATWSSESIKLYHYRTQDQKKSRYCAGISLGKSDWYRNKTL